MMLYVLRHALAEDVAASGDDDARQLTDKGRERTRDAAAGMRAMGLEFDELLTSPIARAAETAEIVAAAYEMRPAPRVLSALATGVSAAEAVAALAPFARNDNVLIVGHEPQLSALVSILLTGSPDGVHLRLRKGACVAMELPDGRIERNGAELQWMMTQRQLRRTRK